MGCLRVRNSQKRTEWGWAECEAPATQARRHAGTQARRHAGTQSSATCYFVAGVQAEVSTPAMPASF